MTAPIRTRERPIVQYFGMMPLYARGLFGIAEDEGISLGLDHEALSTWMIAVLWTFPAAVFWYWLYYQREGELANRAVRPRTRICCIRARDCDDC